MKTWLYALLAVASFAHAEPPANDIHISNDTIGHIERELRDRPPGWEAVLKTAGLAPGEPVELTVGDPHTYPKENGKSAPYYGSAKLLVPSENEIPALAKLYAGCRDPKEVEKTLRNALARGEKKISVTELLPAFAARAGTEAHCDGPNCWNATLNFHGLTDKVEHTTARKMQAALKEHYEPVPKGEKIRPGDVMAIFADEYLQHTAVHVGGEVFFQKRSTLQSHPYAFERFEALSRRYSDRYRDVRPPRFEFYRLKSCASGNQKK